MTDKPSHPSPTSHPARCPQKEAVEPTLVSRRSHHITQENGGDSVVQDMEQFRRQWKLYAENVDEQNTMSLSDYDMMFSHIQEDIQKDQQKFHWFEWKTSTRYLSVLVFIVGFVGLILWLKPRSDLHLYPWPRMFVILALLSLGLLAHAWYMLRPLYKPAASRWFTDWLLPWGGLSLPLLLAAWPLTVDGVSYNPASSIHAAKDTLICLIAGSIFAAPLLWLGYRLSRRLPTTYVLISGSAGGLFGNMVLQVFCPKSTLAHTIFGHGILGLVLLLVLYSYQQGSQREALSNL